MKALKSLLAELIIKDEKGSVALKDFIAKDKQFELIELSDGTVYKVSSTPLKINKTVKDNL